MRLTCVLLLLFCTLAAKAYRPPWCDRARCPPLACRYPYTPRGQCCPACPRGRCAFGSVGQCGGIQGLQCPRGSSCKFIPPGVADGMGKCCRNRPRPKARRPSRDCSTVRCLPLSCPDQFTPPGSCCPVCRAPRPSRPSRPARLPGTSRSSRRPPRCTAVLCRQLSCPDQFTPPGACCPVCRGVRPKVPCWEVLCRPLTCPDQYTPPGACCPVCRPRPYICSRVLCPQLSCEGAYTPEGKCCPVCPARPDVCAKVLCPPVYCQGAYTPEGKCCQVCPVVETDPCALYDCSALSCPDQYTPPGQCCPVCSSHCEVDGMYYEEGDSVQSYDACMECSCHHGDIRCQQKQCDYLNCDDSYTPPGECCPKCPDNNGN